MHGDPSLGRTLGILIASLNLWTTQDNHDRLQALPCKGCASLVGVRVGAKTGKLLPAAIGTHWRRWAWYEWLMFPS